MTTMDSVSTHALASPARSLRSTAVRSLVALLALAAIAMLVARTPRPAADSSTRTASSTSRAADDGRPLLLPER